MVARVFPEAVHCSRTLVSLGTRSKPVLSGRNWKHPHQFRSTSIGKDNSDGGRHTSGPSRRVIVNPQRRMFERMG